MWESIGGAAITCMACGTHREMYNELIPKLAVFRYGMQELLVRRILTLAGEEYTFEKFLENDKMDY